MTTTAPEKPKDTDVSARKENGEIVVVVEKK